MQKLRDEINQLKGEQCKPKIAGSKKNKDISSEDERKRLDPPKEKKSKAKIPKIKIDCTEVCKVNPSILPEDAQFKGHKSVIVQEISIIYFSDISYLNRTQMKTIRSLSVRSHQRIS